MHGNLHANTSPCPSRHNSNDASRPGARPAVHNCISKPYLSIGSEEGTAGGEVDGARPVVGHDVVRRLAIVRIDAATSGAGGVGSHLGLAG